MIALARFFDWRKALVIVKPETFIGWHRAWPENRGHLKLQHSKVHAGYRVESMPVPVGLHYECRLEKEAT